MDAEKIIVTLAAGRTDTNKLEALLAQDVRLQTLTAIEDDRSKIIETLQGMALDSSSVRPAPATPGAFVTDGINAQGGGIVAVLHPSGETLSLIQIQAKAPRFPEPSVLRLSPQIKDMVNTALERKRALVICHVDETGQPVLSYRGSLQVLSDTQLGVWIRNAEGGLVRAIQESPKVALMYRDWDPIAQLQFQGVARIARDQEERDRVYDIAPKIERDHDFAKLGEAVVIDLVKVEGFVREGEDLKIVMVSMSSHGF